MTHGPWSAVLAGAGVGVLGGLLGLGGAEFRLPLLVALFGYALREAHRLPAMYSWKEFVQAGGLIAYGADIDANYRRAAFYVDRILKGARPADLPVEQPVKFELFINTKTAKALGLAIPPSLLLRADQTVE